MYVDMAGRNKFPLTDFLTFEIDVIGFHKNTYTDIVVLGNLLTFCHAAQIFTDYGNGLRRASN